MEPASLSWSEKVGDWYLLNLVLKNIDSVAVDQLIYELYMSQAIVQNDMDEETEEKEV